MELLVRTFIPYCEGGLRAHADGKRGSSTYKPESDGDSRLVNAIEDAAPDFVFTQDAGVATRLSTADDTDVSFAGSFNDDVHDSFDTALTKFAGAIVAATTAPFEVMDAPDNCSHYAAACNWAGHNRVLIEEADARSRVYIADLAADACHAHTTLLDPRVYLTVDGVHPTRAGHVFYALSLFKSLGGAGVVNRSETLSVFN